MAQMRDHVIAMIVGGTADGDTVEAIADAILTTVGYVPEDSHRPWQELPAHTGHQWIRRCAMDGEEWPCAIAREIDPELETGDPIAWTWNHVDAQEELLLEIARLHVPDREGWASDRDPEVMFCAGCSHVQAEHRRFWGDCPTRKALAAHYDVEGNVH